MLTKTELRQWINDLQTGMYINCVYCGHRYGPNETEVPADALKRHVASCPEHPMSKLVKACKTVISVIHLKETMNKTVTEDEKDFRNLLTEAVRKATV